MAKREPRFALLYALLCSFGAFGAILAAAYWLDRYRYLRILQDVHKIGSFAPQGKVQHVKAAPVGQSGDQRNFRGNR